MNKNDIKLILVLFILIAIMLFVINNNKKAGSIAEVYYKNEKILTIDLKIDKEYIVDGELGEVVIEVKNKQIRVKKENSPKNICSKEGFIKDNTRALICLPNKIVVKIVGEQYIDGVVY